jgi:hypothetical protein
MNQKEIAQKRRRIAASFPSAEEVLRGSLIERKVFHRKPCARCAAGEGHRVWVLTVTYPKGRNRQFGVPADQVERVRGWLNNYQDWKRKMEQICELNHALLRGEN